MPNSNKSQTKQMAGFNLLSEIDFSDLSDRRLNLMQQGVNDMLEILEEASKENYHVLTAVLNSIDDSPFEQWQHYPPGDIQDKETGSIWFYHAHDSEKHLRPWSENGHFHLFRYSEMVAKDAKPLSLPPEPDYENGGLCHLVAVSFDPNGLPVRIFTTNRWVADEWMYPAETVIELLDGFDVQGKKYDLTTRWLVSLLKLYRPQIEWALFERDRKISEIKKDNPDGYQEDRHIEVLSAVEFDLAAQIDAIEAEISKRANAA